jgi:hypothetical protein
VGTLEGRGKAESVREQSEKIGPQALEAMQAVLTGVPACHAWLDYVRQLYPPALDALAKIAVTNIAIGLLRDNGDLSAPEAETQQEEAADAVAAEMPFFVWEEIHEIRSMLETLEAHMKNRSRVDVLRLEESPGQIRASSA